MFIVDKSEMEPPLARVAGYILAADPAMSISVQLQAMKTMIVHNAHDRYFQDRSRGSVLRLEMIFVVDELERGWLLKYRLGWPACFFLFICHLRYAILLIILSYCFKTGYVLNIMCCMFSRIICSIWLRCSVL
jgi:hypothetical protein